MLEKGLQLKPTALLVFFLWLVKSLKNLQNIPKAFDKVWHAGHLHKLKSYGISGQIFVLISSFLINRRLRVALDGKSSKEYPVNSRVP